MITLCYVVDVVDLFLCQIISYLYFNELSIFEYSKTEFFLRVYDSQSIHKKKFKVKVKHEEFFAYRFVKLLVCAMS